MAKPILKPKTPTPKPSTPAPKPKTPTPKPRTPTPKTPPLSQAMKDAQLVRDTELRGHGLDHPEGRWDPKQGKRVPYTAAEEARRKAIHDEHVGPVAEREAAHSVSKEHGAAYDAAQAELKAAGLAGYRPEGYTAGPNGNSRREWTPEQQRQRQAILEKHLNASTAAQTTAQAAREAAAREAARNPNTGARIPKTPWTTKVGQNVANYVQKNPNALAYGLGGLAGISGLGGLAASLFNGPSTPSPLMPSRGTMPSTGAPSGAGTQQGGGQGGGQQGGGQGGVTFNRQGPNAGVAGTVASGNNYMYSNRNANGWISGKNDFNGMSDIAKQQAAYMNARGVPTAAQFDNYTNQSLTDKNSAGYDAMHAALARMNGQVYQKPQPSAPVPAAPTASHPTMESPAGPASPDIMTTIRGAVNSTFPQNTAENVAANATGPAPAAAPSYQKANQGAIDALKEDPSDERIAQFNALHGPDAHTEHLSE